SRKMDVKENSSYWRDRGLEHLNRRFAPARVDDLLREKLARNGTASLLEIGCGEGRVLLDLRRILPDVRLHGLNKKPWEGMEGPESLRAIALEHGLFTEEEYDAAEAPDIRFGDARSLPYEDGSMDLVVSQVALHYVARKDEMLEEVWRVLKPGGRALLHLDSSSADAPDFLREESPRCIIRRGDSQVPLAAFARALRRGGFAIAIDIVRSKNGRQTHLFIEKNRPEPLKLGLTFDPVSSLDLRVLRSEHRDRDTCWGYRSVFLLPETNRVRDRLRRYARRQIGKLEKILSG
ncbi:MAG: class I SAM-dependent methyltransferase, partial [Planctomycetota bacterium]